MIKTVQELIDDLQKCEPSATIHIYNESNNPVPPDKIVVADNDDETPSDYHLFSTYD